MEKLIEEGRSLELYLESEQADKGSDDLDAVWQSIYDVYHLVCIGIIEGDKEDEAMIEAKEWLEKTKADTSMYQGMVL